MDSYLTAEISASALKANMALLRGCLKPATRLCAVVKADCYGHGWGPCLDLIAAEADWLAVATLDEALALRRLGHKRPVLAFFTPAALGRAAAGTLDELLQCDVTLTATSQADVALLAAAAAHTGRTAHVHVKIDTGMGRSGVPADRAAPVIQAARSQPGLKLTGLYTHFSSADEADKSWTDEQFRRFLAVADAAGRDGLILHAANSAAVIDLPETHLDMVRPGLALYGYQPGEPLRPLPLRPILRLTGRLMQVKDLPAGAGVGYGLTYRLPRPGRVGLVPVGYADGYFRCLTNRSAMRVKGQPVPVRGRVSMDQTSIDLTDLPDAAVGDEVEIIAADPAAPNSVEGLARLAATISYEITCALGPRVRRVRVD